MAATTAAGTLTWLGVRDVIRDTVIERPGPLPVAGADPTSQPPAGPDAAQTDPAQPPDIRNYDVDGGRAVLAVRADGADLVSAVPRPGHGVQTREGDGWLRVEFRRGEQTSSVTASWREHPPRISTQRG
nr:hypothetical protein [Saccharopolyspora sp. HNM0983]